MPMGLDFARRSPWRATTVVVLAIGLCGSIVALWQRQQLLVQRAGVLSQIEANIEANQRVAVSGRPMHLSSASSPEAIAEADRLVVGLQRPWESMLNALQSAIRNDVLVSRLQPETDGFRLRIAGQADSSQAFIEFVQRLRGDASWRRVDPLSEAWQPDASGQGGKPLVFQLSAEWRRP